MNVVWVKSSLSFSNGNCVEVSELPGGCVGVRDSRDPDGPVLRFTRGEWDAFLRGVRLGEFDRFVTTGSKRADVAVVDGAHLVDDRGGHIRIAHDGSVPWPGAWR